MSILDSTGRFYRHCDIRPTPWPNFGGSRKYLCIKSEGASLHGLLFRELVGSAHFRGQLMEIDHISGTTSSLSDGTVGNVLKVTKRHCYIMVLVIKVNTIMQGLR